MGHCALLGRSGSFVALMAVGIFSGLEFPHLHNLELILRQIFTHFKYFFKYRKVYLFI